MNKYKWLVPTIYIIFLMLPIYWLLNMSFKTTTEIINTYSLWPQQFTLDNYKKIFTDSTWYNGYLNSIYYVVINTIISVSAALPAAYAFSRYKFLGDKHLFFVATKVYIRKLCNNFHRQHLVRWLFKFHLLCCYKYYNFCFSSFTRSLCIF